MFMIKQRHNSRMRQMQNRRPQVTMRKSKEKREVQRKGAGLQTKLGVINEKAKETNEK